MISHARSRIRFTPFLLLAAASLALSLSALASTPAAPPVPAPAAPQNSTPAPAQPAPTEPPAAPAPAARREEEEPGTPTAPPAPGATARPSIFARASSYLHGREALAGEIASRDRTIGDLRTQLAQRDQTIATQLAELTDLRAGRDQLQAAVNRLEGESRTVTQTVASLGFEQTKLPNSTPLDRVAENSVEGLMQKMKEEPDDEKRAELRQQIIALRDAQPAAR